MFVKFNLFNKMLMCCLSISSFTATATKLDIESESKALLNSGVSGFSIAILDNNGLILSKGYGYADVKNKIPMTDKTIQNIGSISKTITGAAAMQLVEQGKLDLDENINTYLPFSVIHPIFPNTAITARQLLTHTSAIVDRSAIYDGDLSYHYGGDNPIPLGDFLKDYFTPNKAIYSIDNFATYAPGTERKYSNVAYGLIAHVVENISNMPFNHFTKKHIFTPLGMKSTGWMLSDIKQSDHAQLYKFEDEELKKIEWYGLVTWPDGGLRTSVTDLSKFIITMINEGRHNDVHILEPRTVQSIFTPQFSQGSVLSKVKERDSHKQAITWNVIKRKSGDTIIGHNGGDPGIRTYTYFDPKTSRGMVLFLNTASRDEGINKAVSTYIQSLLSIMNQKDIGKLPIAKPLG